MLNGITSTITLSGELNMLLNKKALSSIATAGIVLLLCVFTGGCTPTEETNTLAALQSALSTLVANRTLSEQFVRDVKTSVDPTDPAYQQAMESYEEARDSYNHFLDTVEDGAAKGKHTRQQMQLDLDAQNSAAGFLQDATRALKPSMNTRGIDFRRAIQIPANLAANLHRLPRHQRGALVEQFDNQVRWRSWGQM